jgi:hypothetical protein
MTLAEALKQLNDVGQILLNNGALDQGGNARGDESPLQLNVLVPSGLPIVGKERKKCLRGGLNRRAAKGGEDGATAGAAQL